MISNADTDCDPDSDPDIEDSSRLTARFRVTQGWPERQSLSGSHGQRPWSYVGNIHAYWQRMVNVVSFRLGDVSLLRSGFQVTNFTALLVAPGQLAT